jgi:hypothetical protein
MDISEKYALGGVPAAVLGGASNFRIDINMTMSHSKKCPNTSFSEFS